MDTDILHYAVKAVRNGQLIVYPTDTLYGLGSAINQINAINTIFTVKNRPLLMPLPIAVSDKKMLSRCVNLTPLAKRLADRFFPGKITLICQKTDIISDLITAGGDTVAVRIPEDNVALQLIKRTGPLIATSANRHGYPTPATVSEIRKLFKSGIVEVYVDDGPRSGKASTIVDVTGSHAKILREGSIPTHIIHQSSELE